MRRGGRARGFSVGRNIVETIVGALVLVVAGVFVFYAFAKSDRSGPAGYEIIARFDRIDGLKRGADVTLSGVKVGTVTGFDLDRKTYQAVVRMLVSSNVSLPADTHAKIVSESLLGGMVVVLEPGGDAKMLPAGGEIQVTQGAIPLSELIAKFMFGGTSSGSK
jgi:phospholipid/cholesterol/gamma-HCH transport system substrate-binding protein